jgi:hypothetical protein
MFDGKGFEDVGGGGVGASALVTGRENQSRKSNVI